MTTLPELINEIASIREAVDMIEVKGQQNRMLITFAFEKCNKIIEALNATIKEVQQAQENQNRSEEVSNIDQPQITEFPKSEEITEG